ncbi:MAG: ABC transporter permease [Planctomycetes bacterium]|nr:ABC transporter permease [Planctomycetota bacterium]MCC7170827.1 ABC transporter permease [Planctomycetota bacterium]
MSQTRAYLILAAREVESYFLAPLMFLVFTVFLVLNGFAFYLSLGDAAGNVDLAVRNFLGGSLLFWINILLVPPLLTMRLVAEEKRTGTIEGLMTAPVQDVVVVLAKFTGALCFWIALWAPSIVYLLILRGFGSLPDPGILATSYLGVLLLGALLLACGLLASAVSPNQIVSAVLAVVFDLLLFFFPLLSMQMPQGALRRGLEHVSVLFHFQSSFGKGVLDTGVIAVYLVGTALPLFFAVRALESRRWS